jgi:hypothetical protein
MTEETLETLFDRSPTRELEEVQKVNEVSQAERDIDEFYETESAREVLTELGGIINSTGAQPRFRYVHATFGSGKTHLLKLIGIATGEIDRLEGLAPKLSSQFSGFKAFREDLDASNIDHLIPIFMNLLDRDKVRGSTLSLLIYEELGNQLGYPTDPLWLLEWVWQLEIEHGLWSALSSVEHDGMTVTDAAEDKAALRPWLYEVLPQMDETDGTPYETQEGVRESISEATDKIEADEFTPDELVERLDRTKRYLQQSGETYEFLIGLDEVAIYVGDQQHRYREFLETVETLIAEINPPILGTGQWSLRDMQRDFIGEVDPDAWYTNEIPLRGADTEVIVRKRWLRKSDDGAGTVQNLLESGPEIEPEIDETADYTDLGNPVEAYPFREHDLWLLREVLQSLKKEDLEVDREYVQGRALLILVRSLFTGGQWSEETDVTPWAERDAGQIVPWDEIYDLLHWETMDVPGWAKDQLKTVENTTDEMGVRVAKVLYLIGQVDFVPNTKENITRLLVRSVETDVEQLNRDVENALESLIEYNFVRTDEGAEQQTYRFLSKEIVEFWDQVNQEATDIPTHQLRYHITDLIREADRGRLTADDSLRTQNFDGVSDVPYACRYTVLDQVEQSPEPRYDGVVVRVLAVDSDVVTDARESWQGVNSGDQGVEDLLVTLDVSIGLQERIRHVIAMDSVLGPDADPQLRIEQQQEEEAVEDEIEELLHSADIFTPEHGTSRGTYIQDIDRVMAEAVSEKFENRKTLETRLQEVDDARKLFEFFNGNGPWPFTAQDANELGVKTVPREISGGWAEEFLNDYAGEDLVGGETVLEEIEGRRGKYLGTPREALSALLITLAAANKIEIRRDGVRIEDIGEIGRVMRRRSDIRDIDIGFDPVDIDGSADLKSVYQSLRGFSPQGDDPTAWLTSLAEWAEENSSQIRNVCARVDIEFDEEISLDELREALEPGMAGDDLDDEVLTESPVPTQAEWYRKAEPLFAGDDPLWDTFTDTLETMQSLYPDAAVTYRMEEAADGSQIPSQDRLTSLWEDAEEFRRSQVSELYQILTGSQPEAETVEELCTAVEEELSEGDLVEELERIRETIPGIEFKSLSELVQKSQSPESVTEHDIASSDAVTEAQRLETARTLLEDRPDGGLYTRLEEKYEQLNSHKPDEFITTQIERALRGPELVSGSRAEALIEQADAVLSADEDDDGTDDDEDDGSDEDDGQELPVDELWAEVTTPGDGTIVVIDPTEDEQ